jgi:hypothetical protein
VCVCVCVKQEPKKKETHVMLIPLTLREVLVLRGACILVSWTRILIQCVL